MISITADTFATIDVFSSLDRASRAKLVKLCVAKSYPRSQVIVAHQEQSTDIFFIVSGSVRATIFTERGQEVAYQDLFSGEMFGELSAVDRMPRATHVVALEDSILISMPREHFSEMLTTYPAVAQATLQKIVGMVRFLCDRVYEFRALDVNERIRSELIRLAAGDVADPNRATVPKMPTHQELANRLATHREAVSRELSSLEKIGVIVKQGHSLVIEDVKKLRAMTGHSNPVK